jgi:hypothetical protein
MAKLKAKIAGSENKPAEEVFKNVKMFKGAPASRLLRQGRSRTSLASLPPRRGPRRGPDALGCGARIG